MDKNLEFQKNLSNINLAIVVLRAKSNAYAVVTHLIPKLNGILSTISPGEVV